MDRNQELAEIARRHPGHVPHWQAALDARFEAIRTLTKTLDSSTTVAFQESIDLNDPKAVRAYTKRAQNIALMRAMGFGEDMKFLQTADTYSFNGETIVAIGEAANSIPHDTPLSAIETPNTGAGWFWFAEPLKVTASPVASDSTHALLWAWVNGETLYKLRIPESIAEQIDPDLVRELMEFDYATTQTMIKLGTALRKIGITQSQYDTMRYEAGQAPPSIMFSAYVLDEGKNLSTKIVPIPSTRWFWPVDQTFHEMLAFNTARWNESYGPGGKYEGDANVMGQALTLKCIAELSLFFLAACVWFTQKILIASPGHIERHARKRMQKEHKLAEPPSVRVIALRASVKQPAAPREGEPEKTTREYHCRWIVSGHMRLQRCGPGRKDQKLIFIAPHPAGPEDKPLRTRETVYAVIR